MGPPTRGMQTEHCLRGHKGLSHGRLGEPRLPLPFRQRCEFPTPALGDKCAANVTVEWLSHRLERLARTLSAETRLS